MFTLWLLVGLLTDLLASSSGSNHPCGKWNEDGLIRAKRIVAGNPSQRHRWPWIVSIQAPILEQNMLGQLGLKGFVHQCGGSLVDREWVLTAAHCLDVDSLDPASPASFRVVLGAHNLAAGSENEANQIQRKVARMVVHPGYRLGTFRFDLALLKLEQPVHFSRFVQPICLPRGPEESYAAANQSGILAGWGYKISLSDLLDKHHMEMNAFISLEDNKINSTGLAMMLRFLEELHQLKSNKLSEMRMKLLSASACLEILTKYSEWLWRECQKVFNDTTMETDWQRHCIHFQSAAVNSSNNDLSQMICASPHPDYGRDSAVCNGDSGHPLMWQRNGGSWVQIGVTSIGLVTCAPLSDYFQNGSARSPVYFSDVVANRDWIQTVMSMASTCHLCSWWLTFILCVVITSL